MTDVKPLPPQWINAVWCDEEMDVFEVTRSGNEVTVKGFGEDGEGIETFDQKGAALLGRMLIAASKWELPAPSGEQVSG